MLALIFPSNFDTAVLATNLVTELGPFLRFCGIYADFHWSISKLSQRKSKRNFFYKKDYLTSKCSVHFTRKLTDTQIKVIPDNIISPGQYNQIRSDSSVQFL